MPTIFFLHLGKFQPAKVGIFQPAETGEYSTGVDSGYAVSTVGFELEQVKQYIREQEAAGWQ
jgi:hypothetical protein